MMLKLKETMIMNAKEEKLQKILQRLGFTRTEADCLIYMLAFKEGLARDMEKVLNLRQPDVCIGLNNLLAKKIVSIQKKPSPYRKGRPVFKYTLAKTSDELVNDLIETGQKKIDNLTNNLNKLRQITDGIKEEKNR